MEILELALYEVIWFCVIVAVEHGVRKAAGGSVQNFEETGPSWTRILYKFWMALHIVGLLFLMLLDYLYKRVCPDHSGAWPRLAFLLAVHLSNGALLLALGIARP